MRQLGRGGQGRVDGAGLRMDQVGPARVPEPEGGAAILAEAARGRAFAAVDFRVIFRDVVRTLYFQAFEVSGQIDGIAAAAGGLLAGRSVAAI